MPRRREQLGRKGWEDDPLVPIHPEFLRAAIVARDWSVQKLAKETGNESQTLDHLAKGSTSKKCRQSRRRGLAEALGVPESWLEGSNRAAVPELQELPRYHALALSPRLQLALGYLLRRAGRALKRDLSSPEAQADLKAHQVSEPIIRRHLFYDLFELVRVEPWRAQLTTWRAPAEEPQFTRPGAPGFLQDFDDIRAEATDRAALGLVAALEAALEPWLTGEAALDYGRLRVLVGYDRLNPPPSLPHPRYQGQAASPVQLIPGIALGSGV